jgi:hypothetical protein
MQGKFSASMTPWLEQPAEPEGYCCNLLQVARLSKSKPSNYSKAGPGPPANSEHFMGSTGKVRRFAGL